MGFGVPKGVRWKKFQWPSVFLWISLTISVCFVQSSTGGSLQIPRAPAADQVLSNGLGADNEENGFGSLNNEKVVDDQAQIEETRGASVEQAGAGNDFGAIEAFSNNEVVARPPRAAVYDNRRNLKEVVRVKHVQRIPAAKSAMNTEKHPGTSPPPDESDEDDFETLEANREAFIEMLNEHAKRPHRRRSYKRHSDKFQLKYDWKTKRYSITEKQSDEF